MDSSPAIIETEITEPAAAPVADAKKPRRRKRSDHHLWGTYILLVLFAIVELFSASIQEVTDGNIFAPVIRHGTFIAVGFVIMLVLERIHYRVIYNLAPYFLVLCMILMAAVLVAGKEINGATRAIVIAGIPILPAELLKLAAALGMAYVLTKFHIPDKHDVTTAGAVWCMVIMGVCALLLFSQGLSNTLVTVAICFSMMLVGGMGWKKLLICFAICAVAGGLAYTAKTTIKKDVQLTPRQERMIALNKEGEVGGASGRGNTWNSRIEYYKRPNKHLDKFDVEHQQEQLSFIAQAHGGWRGVGLGNSRENGRLPLAFSDYIFAIIIEEWGLFAGIFLLCVYLWILGRSAKLTMQFRHPLPGILAMGCAFVIVFQALYHMAIVTGVFPVSGQPLPLISKGGISVIVTSAAFGIMLSTARHAARFSDSKAEIKAEQERQPDATALNPAAI